MVQGMNGAVNGSMAFDRYALYYDLLYSDKDYESECDFIEEIFKKYGSKPKNLLDIGCGTGGHLIPLVKRGFSLVGLDASPTMLKLAHEKLDKRGLSAELYEKDVRDFEIGRKFDACLCMFAVLNYVTTNEGLMRSFRNIRRHLNERGLLIFDFWYGPAVLSIKPSVRVKEVKGEGIRVLRIVDPEMDVNQHLCKINYHLIVTKGKEVVDDIRETHAMRYLFPQEIQYMLAANKLKILHLCEFLNLDIPSSEKTWNVTAVAKAI